MRRRTLAISLTSTAFIALGLSTTAVAATPPVTIAVIGDFGAGTPGEGAVANVVNQAKPSAIVTVGDNVYAPLTYAQAVGRYYAPAKLYPATGNHDYSQGPIAAYRSYFPTLKGRTVYSVRRGPIEFFILDSQAALDSSASMAGQQAWLKGKLQRSSAQWKVVVLHHPPFSSGAVHGSTPEFEWPYASWGADLVISGHDHDYERIVKGAITYIVDGTGGANLYPFSGAVDGSRVRITDTFGALILRATALSLTGRFQTTDGTVKDTFTLAK